MLNINDDLMNKLERISKHKNIDIDTLLNEVLNIGIDNYDAQESGGLVLRLPNPQMRIPLERNSQSAIAVRLSAPNGKFCINQDFACSFRSVQGGTPCV